MLQARGQARGRTALLAALTTVVGLAGVGLAAAPARAGTTPTPGDVFVVETGKTTVTEVPVGAAQTTVGSGLKQPGGVAVDASENVYVADTANNRVVRIAPDGTQTTLTAFTGLSAPSSVAVDAAGDVFAVDYGNHRVLEVPAGAAAAVQVPADVATPYAVAVDALGNLYVTDLDRNQIVEEPAGGGAQLVVASGSYGGVGLAVDSSGDVFVATDDQSGPVFKLSPDGNGTYVRSVIGQGFFAPTGVAVDAAGNVYVSDAGDPTKVASGRVYEVNAANTSQSTVGTISSTPYGLAVYAPPPGLGADTPPPAAEVGAAYSSYTYHAVTPMGEPAARFRIAAGTLPPGLTLDPASGVLAGTPTAEGDYTFTAEVTNAATGTLAPPMTIGVRPVPSTGDVFVADSGHQRVLEYPADGHAPITIASGVTAFGVAVDPAGNVLVADPGSGTVTSYPVAGGPAVSVGSGLLQPRGVSVDSQGDIVIADTGNARVVEVSHGMQTTVSATGLMTPTGAVADVAGNVFITDSGADDLVEVIANNGGQAVIADNLSGPTALAVGTANKVYVVEAGTLNGDLVTIPVGGGAAPTVVVSGLNQPGGVALDATGRAVVGEAAGNQVVSVAPDGSSTPVGSGLSYPIGVAVYAPAPTFVAQAPPTAARMGTPYSYGYTVTTPPGAPAPTYQVVAGGLPPGVTLDRTTGALSGTPSATGAYSFTVEVDNPANGTRANPATVSVRPAVGAGDVFVADALNQRVVEFPVGGGGSPVPVSSGTGRILGVDVDASENVFAGDYVNNVVVGIPADGGPATSSGTGLDGPQGVATDAAGNLYVADSQNKRVIKLSADRATQTVVASGLGFPTDVAVDLGGNVFIADATNNRVLEVTPGGGTPTVVAGLSDGVIGPEALAVDTAGTIYAAELNNRKIVKIVPGATPLVTTFATEARPSGIDLDAAGDVFVTDTDANTIVEFAPDGTLLRTFGTGLNAPSGVAVYAPAPILSASTPPITGAAGSPYEGYTYTATVADGEPAATFRVAAGTLPPGLTLDPATGRLKGTTKTPGDYTFVVEADNAAHGVLAAPATIRVRTAPVAGDLFYDDLSVAAVTELPATGAGTVGTGGTGGTAVQVLGSPVSPIGVAVDGAGDVFTGSQGTGRVAEVTADGRSRSIATGLVAPTALAADAAGDVFATGYFDSTLVKVPAGGGPAVVLATGLLKPSGVAVDPAGDVYVSDTGHNRVLMIPAGGGPAVSVATGLGPALNAPVGLATDAVGDLYIADSGNDRIVVLFSDGGATFTGSGFKAPNGVAVDAYGDLFVTDGKGRIVELAAGGTQSDLVTGESPDSLAVFAPAPGFTAATPTQGTAGTSYSYTFTASRPANEPSPGFTLVDGALPPGLTLDGATGTLSGTPSRAGTYPFTVEAHNAATGSFAATSVTIVKGAAATLVLTPGTATTSAGTPVAYRAEGFDSVGEDLGDVTAGTRFTLSGGTCSGASCTPSRATPPGSTDTVTGTFTGPAGPAGPATGTAQLTVTTGPIDHLVLSPGNTATTAGAGVTYRAESFDSVGEDLGDVTGATIFTIAGGTCVANVCTTTAATPAGGTVTVTGTAAGRTGSAFETVAPSALDHISLALSPATVGGKPVTATVSGFDVYGNARGDVTAGSTLSITPDGACVGAVCTPRTGGAHTVTATIATPGGSAASASAAVTFTPGYPVPALLTAVLHVTDGQGTVAYTVAPAGASPVTVTVTASARGQKTRTVTVTATPAPGGGVASGVVTVGQLADGNSYAFTITATSLGGKVTAGVGKGTPSRVPGLTLTAAHDKVTKGTVVVLTGLLVNGKGPVPGRTVTLTGTVNGHARTLSRTKTDRHGAFVFHVRPTAGTSYTATAVFGTAAAPTIARNTPTHVSIVKVV